MSIFERYSIVCCRFLRTIIIKENINESVLFLTSNVIDLFYFWWINPMSHVFISATFVAEYKMLIRRRPDVGGHSVKYKQNENITVFVKYIHINQFIHTQKVHNYRFIYIPSSGNCIPWILTYIAWLMMIRDFPGAHLNKAKKNVWINLRISRTFKFHRYRKMWYDCQWDNSPQA